MISANTVRGTAAYESGLDIDDEILKLDGTVVKNANEFSNYILSKKPGDAVEVTYKHRNTEKNRTLVMKEQATYAVMPFEQTGKAVTGDMKRIRENWHSSQVK